MKKVTALFLAILMLTIPTALASGDLAGMTLEQLIQLRTQIEAELLIRGESESLGVPPGRYIVGVDIPAGIYKVTVSNSSVVGGMLVVYPDKKKMDSQGAYNVMELLSGMTGNEVLGKVELNEGNGVWISNGMLTFEMYKGIGL
ncbi:MAG: hypothetical protein GX171_02665 [Clostridiales bacterium]|jgi:hypothetical protein|nr:hypothetical protein [Clostridiales bacterium]